MLVINPGHLNSTCPDTIKSVNFIFIVIFDGIWDFLNVNKLYSNKCKKNKMNNAFLNIYKNELRR